MLATLLCARKIRPLPEPTSALPGTPEKLAIVIGRAARGEELWHPDDAQLPGTKARLGFLDSQGNAHTTGASDEDEAEPVTKPKTSRYVGVDLHANGVWRAQLAVAGGQIYLGVFATEEEAAEAVKRARTACNGTNSHR